MIQSDDNVRSDDKLRYINLIIFMLKKTFFKANHCEYYDIELFYKLTKHRSFFVIVALLSQYRNLIVYNFAKVK